MVTTYGSFPGVQVEVSGGGITAVAIGEEEKLVLFGEASYQNDGDFTGGDGDEDPLETTLTGSPETTQQINARREADTTFGEGSELAEAMREALANGANADFLYGVAPVRYTGVETGITTQSGTLANAPIVEDDVQDESNIVNISATDTGAGTIDNIEYTYESPPTAPLRSETLVVNPLTGEYEADAAPDTEYEISYKYLDWSSVFSATEVQNVVGDDETAIFAPLTEADSVSTILDNEIDPAQDGLRKKYQLVNAISGAEPNANEVITTDGQPLDDTDESNYEGRDARFDTSTFSKGSVDSDYYFKFAPVRVEDSSQTILGGLGGLFASNPLNDPIYNDTVSQLDGKSLEQSFTKSQADEMRDDEVIPIRQAGSIRVKDNLSTSTETDWERDFWRRRIADRVILIGKNVGDTILGQINDEQTRDAAARLIRAELRELVNDRLLEGNTVDETNWFVDVYEDSSNPNQVNIDIGFTPVGIVKRIDESITINT